MANYKGEHIARDIAQKLRLRLGPEWMVVEGEDRVPNPQPFNARNPVLRISRVADGPWATTNPYVFVRIKGEDTIQTDSIGMPQRVYAPHVCQVVVEGDANSAPYTNINTLFTVVCTIANYGMKLETYMTDDGTEPTDTEIENLVPGFVFYPDIYHPLTSQI